MRIFKNTWFTRFARKEGVTNDELKEVVNRLEEGEWDADLGGHVYKQRIARPGGGRSGGYRVIICFKSGERSFFVYGFAKSDRGNISQKEQKKLKDRAYDLLTMPENLLQERLKKGTLLEVF